MVIINRPAKAREWPEAWLALKKEMKGRRFGREECRDAWDFFLAGWVRARGLCTLMCQGNGERDE